MIIVDNKRWNKIVENKIKFIDVAKEWMHRWMMENVYKIKIKLENIWIDLIMGIYAPYNVNFYGPLWTPTRICAVWTYFLIILYVFPFLFLPKRLYHPPYHWQSYDRLSPSPQHHVWLHPPIFSCLLLFTPHSPVICKDNFPLVYMYKLSRYYAVFHIDLGPMFPQSTSL